MGILNRWIVILIVLILVYLILKNANQFKRLVTSTTGAQVGVISALQGRHVEGGY